MTDFKFRNFVLCEDARREISGKEILIGVYDDNVIIGSVPAILDRLFFRVAIDCDPLYRGKFSMSLRDPEGNQKFNFESVAAPPFADYQNRIFGVSVRGLQVLTVGHYDVYFGLDEPMRKVWSIAFREAANDAERERLALVS